MSPERFSSEYKNIFNKLKSIRLLVFDFDGVMTDNAVYVSQDGTEMVRCDRGDGMGVTRLHRIGLEMMILSTEVNPVVSARARKLKLSCIQECENKSELLRQTAEQKGIALEDIAFVGNDINDLECLRLVGVPIVVQDAHPSVIPYAKYRTLARGGNGAVREICDLIEWARSC